MNTYEKLNLIPGRIFKADHITHMEEGLERLFGFVSNIITIVDGETISLENNKIYRAEENLTSLTLTVPEEVDDTYRCAMDFGCGDTALALTYPATIIWTGDSLDYNGLFVPLHNHRYHIDIWYDGLYIRGNASGVSV